MRPGTCSIFILRDEHCLHAAEDIVESQKVKFGDRISALGLLPQFQHLTEDESQRVFELVVNCLTGSRAVVRMAASDALAGLGNPSGIPYLEAAIARESEEGTRSAMERDLKKLQPNARNKLGYRRLDRSGASDAESISASW